MEPSAWQNEAKLSKFDAEARQVEAARQAALAAESDAIYRGDAPSVPHTTSDVYMPDHPDADWRGYVDRKALKKKKHFTASHENVLKVTETGITTDKTTPGPGDFSAEQNRLQGKKLFSNDLRNKSVDGVC